MRRQWRKKQHHQKQCQRTRPGVADIRRRPRNRAGRRESAEERRDRIGNPLPISS